MLRCMERSIRMEGVLGSNWRVEIDWVKILQKDSMGTFCEAFERFNERAVGEARD